MKSRRIVSLLAVAALATTVFVGCGSKEAGLKDGTYTAQGQPDDKGNTASIEIEVKDGKIATVKYDEVSSEGVSKLDNEEYNTKMKSVSGTNPIEAFPALEKSLVEKQDVASVDTVTGATSTSNNFKTLAEEALKSAK
ncbi:FMN-binding protein [Clostridium sp. Sa3CUN1]|uniref:FMN-binding protein n=1 Tax=Clostridium gallinarum TaxID=2762246 RepID=A0ABR8Q405_9CLOT|nr:FMN-binding protein [Clostridium gallinarum]MBD7915151.1 FMN-binding protein [Clostridium gallinarum]